MSARRVVLALLAAIWLAGALAAGRGEPGPVFAVRVPLGDPEADLALLHDLDLDVDAVFFGWARVYVVPEEAAKLRALGFAIEPLPAETPDLRPFEAGSAAGSIEAVPTTYHTYESLTAELQQIAAERPDLVRLVSLGKSVQGRELWMMKVSRNPGIEEDEPEAAYVAAMHGDEVVGKEMCVDLIHHLLDNYASDPRVRDLVDGLEIWILPSMNPDGTALVRRYNANYVDLNRDFPDQFVDPTNTPDGREPETAAVMAWGAEHPSTLSANFHGGTLVANYPWDGNPTGQSVYSICPDDSAFVSLARTYADLDPPMSTSNSAPSFDDGITNGADWYAINGGLQDWSYVWRGDLDLTLEISTVKWPSGTQLPQFWDDNRESMLAYLERALEGVRGIVTDAATGAPLAASVTIAGNPRAAHTDPDVGDFHRFLLPGAYTLQVSSTGYATRLIDATVDGGPARRYDVALEPLGPSLAAVSGCAAAAGGCDPWLEPGAASDLAVTLRNLGTAAHGIAGDLVPTGFDAAVVRARADYPDLVPDASGTSLAPHHRVEVSAGAPPGRKAGFALRWSASEGGGATAPFFVPIGAPACVAVDATDLPRAILDRATTESTLAIPDVLEISDLRVGVGITHGYVGDLRVDVVTPSGTPIALHARSGGSSDDIVGTYGVDLVPFEPLSRARGEDSSGTWTLRVRDGVPANTGTLDAFRVEVCGRPFEALPPEIRLAEVAREGAGVRLAWWPYPGLTSYRVYRSSDPSSAGEFADVTAGDDDPADTTFADPAPGAVAYYLVTGVGAGGEGPKGHFGE